VNDLVAWLRARLDEDEAVARAATPGKWSMGRLDEHEIGDAWMLKLDDKRHIARHDPARVLREVAAKRAIVDAYEHLMRTAGIEPSAHFRMLGLEQAVEHLASVYADHAEYREEWR